MRKGALKKKQRQLEELHLDRREALGELVLGMYVQGNWDDNLLARGAAEVAEVERELRLLISPDRDSGPGEQPSGEMDTGEDFPATREYTAEHDLPPTGEYTAEHDLPPTGEHVLRRPGEHTEEHLLPSWRDGTSTEPRTAAGPGRSGETPAAEPEPPAKPEKPEKPQQPVVEKEPSARQPETTPDPEAAVPSTRERKPPTVAPTPSATAPVPAAGSPKPTPVAKPSGPTPPERKPETPAAPASETATAGTPGGETPPAAPATPESPLVALGEKIEADQRRARNAIDAAKATLKTESRTETAVISKEVAEGHEKLTAILNEAAALITGAEERAAAAEAKLTRESAAAREAAAGWVRSQAAEIEADAALAVEIEQEEGAAGTPSAPDQADPVLTARVAALEAELAAEKAAKTEALVKAEARLKQIETEARAAEERVAAAAEAAAAATPAPATTAPEGPGRSEAETREAAVAWLRGQIGALRRELAQQDNPPAKPAGQETERGDS